MCFAYTVGCILGITSWLHAPTFRRGTLLAKPLSYMLRVLCTTAATLLCSCKESGSCRFFAFALPADRRCTSEGQKSVFFSPAFLVSLRDVTLLRSPDLEGFCELQRWVCKQICSCGDLHLSRSHTIMQSLAHQSKRIKQVQQADFRVDL